MSKLLIIGPGRVGTGLSLALKNAQHTIVGAVGLTRTSKSSEQFETLVKVPVMGIPDTKSISDAVEVADIILFTVRDRDIHPLAKDFANRFSFRAEHIVCHTAGALGLFVLQPLEQTGARTGSLHPLQTFVDPVASAAKMPSTHFAVTGDASVRSILISLVHDMGAHAFCLNDDDRERYHAAAALTSNGLVALVNTAASLMPEGAGFRALLPLIQGTIDNLYSTGLPGALTGPIERGDISTVRRHLGAIFDNPVAKEVYAALGAATVDVAMAKGSIDEQTKKQFLQLLLDGQGNE